MLVRVIAPWITPHSTNRRARRSLYRKHAPPIALLTQIKDARLRGRRTALGLPGRRRGRSTRPPCAGEPHQARSRVRPPDCSATRCNDVARSRVPGSASIRLGAGAVRRRCGAVLEREDQTARTAAPATRCNDVASSRPPGDVAWPLASLAGQALFVRFIGYLARRPWKPRFSRRRSNTPRAQKTYGPPRLQGVCASSLISLRQRIRPMGRPRPRWRSARPSRHNVWPAPSARGLCKVV